MQSLKVQIHEIERLYYIESNCKAFVCSSLPLPKPLHLHVSPPPSSTIYITLSTVSSHKRSFVSLSFHQNGSHSKDPQPPLCHPSLQTHPPSAVPIPITASTLHPHARTAHSHPKTTTTKRTNSERKKVRLCTTTASFKIPFPYFPFPRCQMPIANSPLMLH